MADGRSRAILGLLKISIYPPHYMALLGILISALWLAALALCLELLFPKFFKRRRRRPRRQSQKYSPSPLEARLINMVGGDRTTAHRLIRYTQQEYPNRPQQWCLEKAIYDLERDRR